MLRFMNILFVILWTQGLVRLAQAAPTLQYPLMEQQPPVARVDQSFDFDILYQTFSSPFTITYTTSGLPAWLEWNEPSLAFFGTPKASDVGQQTVTLTATDSSGSTSTTFLLIVTEFSMPGVHQAFTTQLGDPSSRVISSASVLPGNTGVSVPPHWSFSLGFAMDTFRLSHGQPVNGNLFVSARVRGMIGLPTWLNFNNNTMTFDGVTPASGSFTVVVTGTDFWGYLGAQTSFVIEVGSGPPVELVKGYNFTDIVTMARNDIQYQVDISKVLVNGTAATASDIVVSLNETNYPWLSLDSSSLALTGTAPDFLLNGTVTPLSIPINIAPAGEDNSIYLTTWLSLDATPYFFTDYDVPAMNVTPKSALSFDLKPYLNSHNPPNVVVNASVTPKDAANWLVFYQDDMTLAGTVPEGTKYSGLNVLFTASQGGFQASTNLAVTFNGVVAQAPYTANNGTSMATGATGQVNNSTTGAGKISGGNANGTTSGTSQDGGKTGSGSSSGNTSGSGSGNSSQQHPSGDTAPVPNASNGQTGIESDLGGHRLSTGAKIGIAVALGVLGLIILAVLLFLCCRRRKRKDEEEKRDDDAESFTVGSPEANQATPRNFLGDVAKFSAFNMRSPEAVPKPPKADQPTRMDGLRGIFGWAPADEKEAAAGVIATPNLNRSDTSFMGQGDVIGVAHPVDRSPGMASSFTMSEESSLASWESGDSFQWSEEATPADAPRPRDNFTPRYPRNNSPSKLAQLASQHTVGSHDASELGDDSASFVAKGENTLGTFSSSDISGSNFASRNNMQHGDSEEEEEGPAVVTMAERQSFATRNPTERHIPKLRPSKEHITSTGEVPPAKHSRRALTEVEEGMFDDAEEKRRSMAEAEAGMTGLGYPASAIYYSRPNSAVDDRSDTGGESSTIPLPHVGAVNRHRHRPSESGTMEDGKVLACANETFSIHPQINPPPAAQMSGATWSSTPPSTYRAERQEGGQLPGWLHFDARELELWGVPSLKDVGQSIDIKIIEKLPKDKKVANSSIYGYATSQERQVGKLTIE
ncbi:hypothetical protein BD324DRAFT_608221 [Kockovaella imperatae]|uniref:Dystroglycan-type cadherin-like domain-containing protein n=1 Tax=Kockovaella imperatae TaxID=4999 RepID=A0A1Y1UIA8_9TREE|nr:hypothetical protein BD324DRAFT_608221 [Kockovaella imperatae]ORX37719.1 hypothetical protein BD324DRAFT_608221 [Kockovaella imperatae]